MINGGSRCDVLILRFSGKIEEMSNLWISAVTWISPPKMSEEYDPEQVRNRLAKVLAQLSILPVKLTKTGGGDTTEARWVR